jgi:hypothetical protein
MNANRYHSLCAWASRKWEKFYAESGAKEYESVRMNEPTVSSDLIAFPSRTLVIDCGPLNKARSDADVINGLATQTGQ